MATREEMLQALKLRGVDYEDPTSYGAGEELYPNRQPPAMPAWETQQLNADEVTAPQPISVEPPTSGAIEPVAAPIVPQVEAPVEVQTPKVESPQAPQVVGPQNIYQAMDSTMGELDEATTDRGKAEVQLGEIEAKRQQAQADIFKTYEAEATEITKTAKTSMEAQEAVIAKTSQEFADLNREIQKTEVRDRRTTAQKVGGILAIAAAGIADAMSQFGGSKNSHHQDQTIQLIHTMVDRDLDLQSKQLDDKRKSAAAKYSELGIAQARLGNTKEAYTFARAIKKENAAVAVDRIAAESASEATKVRAAGISAQLRGEAAKEKLDVLKSIQKKKLTAMDIVMMKQAGMSDAQIQKYAADNGAGESFGSTGPTVNGQAIPDDRTKANKGEDAKTAGEAGLPGYHMTQPPQWYTQDKVKKASDLQSATNGVKRLGNHLADTFDKIGKAKTDEEAAQYRTEYIATKEMYLSSVSIATEQGVINKADAERLTNAVPPAPPANLADRASQAVSQYWTGTKYTSSAIRAFGANLQRVTDGKLEILGFAPGEAPKAGKPTTSGNSKSPKSGNGRKVVTF